jgi:hypothetical protein
VTVRISLRVNHIRYRTGDRLSGVPGSAAGNVRMAG